MSAVDRAVEVLLGWQPGGSQRPDEANRAWAANQAQALADAGLLRTEAAVCPHVVSSDDGTSYCGLAAARTEQDDINAKIADRVRGVRKVTGERRTAFRNVAPIQIVRTPAGDTDHVFDLLDYLLNGGEG